MDEELSEIEGTRAYILSLCSAIGGLEEIKQDDGTVGQIYCAGDEALACLRDLKKAIRIDSQNNERIVLNALVEFNVVKTDIVPLLLSYRNQRTEVADRFILACVELLVPMTWPLEQKSLDDEDEDNEDENPNVMQCYRKYKLDLLTSGVFETILTMIIKALRKPHRERSTVDHTSIRLVLYLLRNLTAIPDLNMPEFGTEDQIRMSHMQEMLLIRFYESDIMEFLLTIASNSERQGGTSEWNVLVLETIYNLLKYVDPKDVFLYKHTEDSKQGELQDIAAKLSNLLTNENSNKRLKTGYAPSRHNRFGGTYVLDWDGKKRVSHKQVAGFADSAFIVEGDKKTNRVGKRRKLEDTLIPKKVYQNRKALKYLKTISQSFIISCFNAFFDCILKDMQREDDKIVEKDYPRYYYTMKWFLEYHGYEHKAAVRRKANEFNLPNEDVPAKDSNENNDFDYSLVASALNLRTVLFCLRHMRIKTDDKAWFEVQMAVDCFRQMLVTVGAMAKSDFEEHREVAEHIQQNLYYEQTSFDLFLDILKRYKNQSYGYLKAVIMLTHVLLKSLDHYQKGKKIMFIRKKKSQKKKKPAKKGEEQVEEGVAVITTIDSEDESEPEVDKSKEQEYKDIQFKFSTFEQKYVSWDVINAYTSLLELYHHLQPEYLICISNMFHRLMVKRRAEYLFWKLPVMELFNRILQDSRKFSQSAAFGELEQFIRYSTRQFFKAAAEYPLLYVEALNANIKSNRTWWEMPNEEEQLEKQRYEQDVNYIPPSTWERDEPQQPQLEKTTNEDELDADMQDYYFSAFDRRDDLEAEGSGSYKTTVAVTSNVGLEDIDTGLNELENINTSIFNDDQDEFDAALNTAFLKYQSSRPKDKIQEMTEQAYGNSSNILLDSDMTDV